jgi:hypothetical protein
MIEMTRMDVEVFRKVSLSEVKEIVRSIMLAYQEGAEIGKPVNKDTDEELEVNDHSNLD